ncbi:hypothetical protein EG329_008937 [Mollisiaceae sp. DMI_Dod_QoI]|nr:hypothetical protein EG329_008937 [Helotiales sp. DMI_Dod_QoI]
MVLGPLDRRALKTRCEACARRRIKCVGTPPCTYCNKKKLECVPQAGGRDTGMIFVSGPTIRRKAVGPAHSISIKEPESSLSRFFSVFIVKNDFAGQNLDIDDIASSFQTSSSLYHAAVAIGAMDLRSVSSSLADRRSATIRALESYQTSITTFNSDIQSSDICQSDAAMWTTLFLGLFELMYDVTGDGWLKHILYGTSQILQLRGPETHLTGRGRSFFMTIRPFEICRSLIYSESSFLSQPEWLWVAERLRYNTGGCRLREELFDLMLSCSSFSCKVWEVIKPGITTFGEMVLPDIAAEGHRLRALLENWHERFQDHVRSSCKDTWSILTKAYYHAISIYLSGIFDYRVQFDHLSTACLPTEVIQAHVSSILVSIEVALKTTNLAGILFFFPLRVAGARAWTSDQKSTIIKTLKEISCRAFVVADAFVLDLSTLWLTHRTRAEPHRTWD